MDVFSAFTFWRRRSPAVNERSGRSMASQFSLEPLEPRLLLSAEVIPVAEGNLQSDSQPPLEVLSVRLLLDQAVERLGLFESDSSQSDERAKITIKIADLPGWTLAQSDVDGIEIDQDAAGYGWFVDPTPGDDLEYAGGDD